MMNFETLEEERKRKEEALRETDLGLRMRRATSWIKCAEEASNDDAKFIFYWIAFNAAYGRRDRRNADEIDVITDYFDSILELDKDSAIYNAIWDHFSGPIRVFLNNPYVFGPFWKHHNEEGCANWEEAFKRGKKKVQTALKRQSTRIILRTLFDRLYVLRNQLIHGGATWEGTVNRQQVEDGTRIMAFLVPRFVWLMMSNPKVDWGLPYYPVVR